MHFQTIALTFIQQLEECSHVQTETTIHENAFPVT